MTPFDTNHPSSWVRRHTRRLIGLALAPGLLSLAFEAYVGHYAGTTKSGGGALQPVPIWFGLIGFVVVMALCVLKPNPFRIGVRVVGVVSFVVGVVGTALHVSSFVQDVMEKKVFDEQGEDFKDALDAALGVAPPAFAPGAFALMGILLYVLGSRHVLIRLRLPRKKASSAPAK